MARSERTGASAAAWLVAQVGAHAAAEFARRLAPTGLSPAHAGILRTLAQSDGASQQALAAHLAILPSRLVSLVDELEKRGLVERRQSATDRRTHALHLTVGGREMLSTIGRLAREHQDALCAALTAEERETLAALLRRIADQQGLTAGVHPGYRTLGRRSRTGEPAD
ncbi:MAG TPA: MarR family transcriptional regulator [Thermoanaerobaculia bacterium]